MKSFRRTNLLWGIVLLAIAAFVLAYALGYVPAGVWDTALRAAPALLILGGLSMLLRGRVPLGSLLSLLITLALVAGIGVTAFSQRAGQQRDDNRVQIAQALDPGVNLLRIQVDALATDIEITLSNDPASGVTGQFVGSSESEVDVNFSIGADNSATLAIRESQPAGLPRLDRIGRGALTLNLPAGVPVDIELVGQDGDAILNLDGLDLERLNVDVARGNLAATLPDYQPVLIGLNEINGSLRAGDGTLTLILPQAMPARLQLDRGGGGIDPVYDPAIFNYLVGDVLESRAIDPSGNFLQFTLTAPRGQIRVESLP
ncbi:MAG: hypothetical protein IAE89_01035 [Anaerolineae bacterium]|nr:hypothetical protein [Anaerolineae bacterium]